MSRFLLLGLPLICLSASAQQRLDPSRRIPITAPLRDAGILDVSTGRWTRPGAPSKLGSQVVFNNTCSWSNQTYYAGFDWCDENYDEGRIPSPSAPGAPPGAQFQNHIQSIQVAYCTLVGPTSSFGGYDMDLAFFDRLGGDCVGGVPPTPPSVASQATAYIALAGMGLPGSTALGFRACWTVTLDVSNIGMVLASDGNGTFDDLPARDKFIWMQRQNTTANPALVSATADGFVIAGEPAQGGYGACSYDIPCGTGISGLTCGTGLDSYDGSWINVDGVGVGASNQPAGCVNSIAQYGFGTNCYFFGGYPTNPFGSYWLVLTSDGRPGSLVSFCAQTKATTVAGCSAELAVSDLSLATGSWDTTGIPRAAGLGAGVSVGVYIYTHGVGIGPSTFSATVPFGTLCLSGYKRSSLSCAAALLPTQPGQCNVGPLTTTVNCGAGALGIQVGQDVNVQCWYRDPGSVGDANFSNAVFYTVQ